VRGFPEEHEILGEKEEVFSADDMNRAYNEVLQDCKLAVTKNKLSVEDIEKIIYSRIEHKWRDNDGNEYTLLCGSQEKLAQAIHKLIKKRLGV